MVRTGALPCDDSEQVWGGHGDGKRCSGCLDPIVSGEVEYEVELTKGGTIYLHVACHAIWTQECDQLASS